jgi:hypothetical protein
MEPHTIHDLPFSMKGQGMGCLGEFLPPARPLTKTGSVHLGKRKLDFLIMSSERPSYTKLLDLSKGSYLCHERPLYRQSKRIQALITLQGEELNFFLRHSIETVPYFAT